MFTYLLTYLLTDLPRNDDDCLKGIASEPGYVIRAENYQKLVEYLENVVGIICTVDSTPPRKHRLSS